MKTQITLLLPAEVIKKMDQYIYLRRLKSRNLYIESLIKKDLEKFPDDISIMGDFDRENLPLIK